MHAADKPGCESIPHKSNFECTGDLTLTRFFFPGTL